MHLAICSQSKIEPTWVSRLFADLQEPIHTRFFSVYVDQNIDFVAPLIERDNRLDHWGYKWRSGSSPLFAIAKELYAISVGANIKRHCEVTEGFIFDACLWVENDFQPSFSLESLPRPQPDTLYTIENRACPEITSFAFSRKFFYADSETFDAFSTIYKAIPLLHGSYYWGWKDGMENIARDALLHFWAKALHLRTFDVSVPR